MTKTAVEESVFDEPITDSDINESEVESTEETETVSYDDVTGTPIPTQLVKHVRKESRSKKLMHHRLDSRQKASKSKYNVLLIQFFSPSVCSKNVRLIQLKFLGWKRICDTRIIAYQKNVIPI